VKKVFFLSLLLTFNPAFAEEMKFWLADTGGNCRSCAWIAADGEISEKTPENLIKFLKDIKYTPGKSFRLSFNSIGGNLGAGMELGKIIRNNKLTTNIAKTSKYFDNGIETSAYTEDDGICYSACAYAFLGGIKRIIPDGGKYGVHQFYSQDAINSPTEKKFNALDLSRNQAVTSLLASYILEMDVDASLLKISSAIAPWDKMYILSKDELKQYRIDNSNLIDAIWQIKPLKDQLMAVIYQEQQTQEEGNLSISISCGKPKISATLFIYSIYDTTSIYQKDNINDQLQKIDNLKILSKDGLDEIFSSKLTFKKNKNLGNRQEFSFAAEIPLDQLKLILDKEYILISNDSPIDDNYFIGSGIIPMKNGKKDILAVLRDCL
jgi:hypothetical protein